jgi:hypothetical protein
VSRQPGSELLPALLCLLTLGCSDRPVEPAPPSVPTPRVVLSPGALPEGTVDAFGLSLPARSSLKRRTPASISVEVPASFDETLAYIRERVVVGEERRAKKRLFLENVALRAGPEGRRLRIALRAKTSATEVVVSIEASPEDAASEPEDVAPVELDADEAMPSSTAAP